jgi:hypothetical protein
MLASNFRNHRARYERLFNDPRLVILRGPATSPCPRDYFQPAHRRLRLERMVKRRHKPISDSEIVTIAQHRRQEKVGPKQRLRCAQSSVQKTEHSECSQRRRMARKTPRQGLANAHAPPGTLLAEICRPRSRLGTG